MKVKEGLTDKKMDLNKTLNGYGRLLENASTFHVYATNACYDVCGHCYMNAVKDGSPRSKHIDREDLTHFLNLMNQNLDGTITVGLSGGDPLLHPDITGILGDISEIGNIEVLTSGYALSDKNPNRLELLGALVKSSASFVVASPDDPYHSITWEKVQEIEEYIRGEGINPRNLGYPKRWSDPVAKFIDWVLRRWSEGPKEYPVLSIGRAKKLPEELQKKETRKCKMFDPVVLNYEDKLQYGFYACHDGFMNISELRDVENKKDAISLILKRASEDITLQDMIKFNEWYFSNNVRKRRGFKKMRLSV